MRRFISHLGLLTVLGITAVAHAQPPQQAAPPSPAEQPQIEPKAREILQAACGVLAGAKTMSFTAVNTYEKAARNGQPLYYATLNEVTLQRPDKLRVMTPGDGIPDEFYYDGKTMTAYVPSEDLVATAEAPPNIDQLIDAAWEKAAIYFPFSDVILSEPCAVFDKTMTSAFYVGQSKVIGGTTTDLVAVAGEDVQAELWIGTADHLPRLVRVVYPNEPAHALYQTEYSDWHLSDATAPGAFASDRAARAKPMPFAPPGSGQQQPRPGEAPKQP
jgi:hypothetical protein